MKLLLPLIFGGLVLARLAAADETATKTHTLFMGADIDLQEGGAPRRVEAVSGDSFVIMVDGKEKKIPMTYTNVQMKVGYNLKISETRVNVENLVVDRIYTPEHDPELEMARAAGSAAAAQAEIGMAAARVGTALRALGQARAVGGMTGEYEGHVGTAMNALFAADRMMSSDMNNPGRAANIAMGKLAEKLFDAVEIEFRISAPKPLNHPYAVVLAQFSPPGAKPNEMKNWVYASELDPITPETRKVRIRRGGFPPGFELKSCQIHLYNNGQELASTVASKRVDLTRDEAFDYILVDYFARNKGKTLPATLAMGRVPAPVRDDLKARGAVFVQVDKDGLPVAAFADEACASKLDDLALEAALRTLRFKPALKEGKAIVGVARLGSS